MGVQNRQAPVEYELLVGLLQDELLLRLSVIQYRILFGGICHRKDVGYAILVVTHQYVPGDGEGPHVSNVDHYLVIMDPGGSIQLVYVFQQVFINEDIDGCSRVKKDLVRVDGPFIEGHVVVYCFCVDKRKLMIEIIVKDVIHRVILIYWIICMPKQVSLNGRIRFVFHIKFQRVVRFSLQVEEVKVWDPVRQVFGLVVVLFCGIQFHDCLIMHYWVRGTTFVGEVQLFLVAVT